MQNGLVLTIVRWVGNNGRHDAVGIRVHHLRAGEVAVELPHGILELGVEQHGHLVVLLVATARLIEIQRPLGGDAPERPEPREPDLAGAKVVGVANGGTGEADEVGDVLRRGVLGAAKGEDEVVEDEIVGADAEDVESLGDDLVGHGIPLCEFQSRDVLLEILQLLAQGYGCLKLNIFGNACSKTT